MRIELVKTVSLGINNVPICLCQDRYETLLSLESAGFQLVSSVNNTLRVSYITLPRATTATPSCMELLYVNKHSPAHLHRPTTSVKLSEQIRPELKPKHFGRRIT